MSFLPIINIAKIKETNDVPKFGRVVSNQDPDMLGRVKVTLPGIFEGTPDELPWIRRKMDTTFCGLNVEMFDVPEVGSIVQIQWDYDKDTPVYTGAPYNKAHTSKVFTHNYPHEGGFRFGKCIIKFDKATNIMTLTNGNAFIQLDPLGNISLTAKGNMNITSARDMVLTAPNVSIKGNLKVSGSLNCEKGANGAITPLSIGTVAGGIVTGIM